MALATVIGLAAASAQGALVLDLRTASGGTSVIVTPSMIGTDIPLYVWAIVTAPDAVHTNDGLGYLFYSVKSTPAGGGKLSSGGITASTRMTPFTDAGSQNGTMQQLTSPTDGVMDVGSNSATPSAAHVKPRAAAEIFAGGATGEAVGDNGWRWLVQEITFHIGDLIPGNGVTTLSITVPTNTAFIKGANWWEDGVLKNGGSTGAYGTGGTSVEFTPEPATLSLLALGGLLALRRRRSKSSPRTGTLRF